MNTPIFITVVNTGNNTIDKIRLNARAYLYNEYVEKIVIEIGGQWDEKLWPGEEANVRIYANVPYDIKNLGSFRGVVELVWFTVDDDIWTQSIELVLQVIPQGENPLNIVALSTTGEQIMKNLTIIQREYSELVSSYQALQSELQSLNSEMTALNSSYNELKLNYEQIQDKLEVVARQSDYYNSLALGIGIAIVGVVIAITIVKRIK
jgi:hypothetical protein